jgi:uncharacterized protein RhaS with RHS repeats
MTAARVEPRHYNRFRYYDPTIGRYISGDPIGQVGGVNVFAYSWSRPTGLIDPFGLRPPTEGEKAVLKEVFGDSLDTDNIDIDKAWNDRANAAIPGNLRFPESSFEGGDPDNPLKLSDPNVAGTLCHEGGHERDRQKGKCVTPCAILPQIGNSLGIHDPYKYDAGESDPDEVLNNFNEGSVEQRGQMIEDMVTGDRSGSKDPKWNKVRDRLKE